MQYVGTWLTQGFGAESPTTISQWKFWSSSSHRDWTSVLEAMSQLTEAKGLKRGAFTALT